MIAASLIYPVIAFFWTQLSLRAMSTADQLIFQYNLNNWTERELEASRCVTFENKSILISIKKIPIINNALENLVVYLHSTIATFVVKTILKVDDPDFRHTIGEF